MYDIGIDLGTTYSVIAVKDQLQLVNGYPPGTYLPECDVTIIPTPYEEPTFATVLIDDPENSNRFLFARDALQRSDDGFSPVMFSKRKMGSSTAHLRIGN